MRVQVRKWGNSAAVRIPASAMQAASLRIDQAVELREERGRLVIEPVRRPSLAELVGKITPDNLHEPTDWGRRVGKEVW